MRTQGNIRNVYTYNTGDFLASDVAAGATELPLVFALDFEEGGGEAQVVTTDQVVNYTGYDAETQVLYLDNTTPLAVSAEAGTKIEVLPFSPEKRAVVDTGEGFEPFEARVPHNLKAILEDGIRSEESGYEPVSIELDGSEWVIKDILGTPATINTSAITSLPPEVFSDSTPPAGSPGVVLTPLGVGALTGSWDPAVQPDTHDPVIYDVYVSATTPVLADADHFLTSTAGTSQSFSRVNVNGVWVPISISEPSYMAVWARDSDGYAPTLGGEGSGIPRKADLDELNVGELNAETVRTLQAWASTVDADFIFTNNYIMIGDVTTSHIEINPAKGLILYGTNGTTEVVKLDMTVAQLSEFAGKIKTNQLAVFDSLEISGILSRIMSAALLTIGSSTISAPTSQPSLSETTNTRTWPLVPSGFTETGLYWDGTNWNRTIYNATTFVTRIQTINAAASAISDVTLAAEANDRDARGLAKNGGFTYTIRRDNAAAGSGKFYLKKYNADGTPVADTGASVTLAYASKFGARSQTSGNRPVPVRIDASNVVHASDQYYKLIRRFNTSGTYLGRINTPSDFNVESFDVDGSGNYYMTAVNHNILVKVDSAGVEQWRVGSTGSGNGQFTDPAGVRLDASGNIYVVDRGNSRVQKFNSSGVYQSQFGSVGTGNGQFTAPNALDFDSSGNIYVVDKGNHRVQKFNSSHVYQAQFGTYGFTAGGEFDNPVEITVDSLNDIYVVDNGNWRVQKFNSAMVFQSDAYGYYDEDDNGPTSVATDSSNNVYVTEDENTIKKLTSAGGTLLDFSTDGGGGGAEGFQNPQDIAIDSTGNIWIVDNGAHRIKKYNSSGVWQADYGSYGTGDSQFRSPYGIVIDSSDNIYVSDWANIRKFNSSMTFISKWGNADGSLGSANGALYYPKGLAVDNSSGHIYVADDYNNRIQKFTTSGTYVTKWGTAGTANGQFNTIYDVAVAPDGYVYVTDMFNDRVQKFTSTGAYVSKFGTYGTGNGQFQSLKTITITSGYDIYVGDWGDRIQKFNSSHTWQSTLGGTGSGNGQFDFSLNGIIFDGSGNLYAVESGGSFNLNTRVQKFTGTYPPLKKHVATELSATNRVQPTLGWDSVSSNLVVGCCDTNDLDMMNGTNAGLYRYSPSTLAYVSNVIHSSAATSTHKTATFCGIDNFDYGGPRALLASDSTVRVYTYSGSTLTADTSYPTWIYEGTAKAGGWDGVNFHSASDTTALRIYSTFKANPAVTNQRRFWSQYQWETANPLEATLPSPKQSLDLTDRRWLNITVPTPGAGTGYTRIFSGNGPSTTNAQMYALAGTIATTGGTVQTASVLTSGTNPATSHSIPSGAAGRLEAQTGSFKVNGDSVGTWHEQAATPRFYGIMTATQSTAATVPEPVVWTESATHSKDSPGYYSYNATTGALTILKTGWWRLSAQVVWNSTTAGTTPTVSMYIEHTNGTRITHDTVAGAIRVTNKAHTSYFLNANDIIQVSVEQDSGTIAVRGADVGRNFFSVVYDGPA